MTIYEYNKASSGSDAMSMADGEKREKETRCSCIKHHVYPSTPFLSICKGNVIAGRWKK